MPAPWPLLSVPFCCVFAVLLCPPSHLLAAGANASLSTPLWEVDEPSLSPFPPGNGWWPQQADPVPVTSARQMPEPELELEPEPPIRFASLRDPLRQHLLVLHT
ncbi:hypothetical protein K431DRAFT_292467 [Polychaeton citri CBS 116435]|uniref:Uncharacterized protein n=1 Tax=Polychaeton citri CBS 116435 TaxID=1314669 RepID=A0A9P4US52_9PEZI|nr:hypothetical protein K431DRAFT_292467 [Polychaeton citri CBS 116435]